jgi:hypothetical protein
MEDRQMKRPKQLPAVDRNKATKSAAVPVEAGGNVRASFDWASLVQQLQPGYEAMLRP